MKFNIYLYVYIYMIQWYMFMYDYEYIVGILWICISWVALNGFGNWFPRFFLNAGVTRFWICFCCRRSCWWLAPFHTRSWGNLKRPVGRWRPPRLTPPQPWTTHFGTFWWNPWNWRGGTLERIGSVQFSHFFIWRISCFSKFLEGWLPFFFCSLLWN